MLAAHGTPDTIAGEELQQMRDRRLAKTANRSVVGIMNEFTYLAETYRGDTPATDLLGLAMRLATTPCGPLYSKHISPDRELQALLRSITPPASWPANDGHTAAQGSKAGPDTIPSAA
ncbi:hypothetical protein OG589_37520 [Sphaerisporangium sp. NBC_01403]